MRRQRRAAQSGDAWWGWLDDTRHDDVMIKEGAHVMIKEGALDDARRGWLDELVAYLRGCSEVVLHDI